MDRSIFREGAPDLYPEPLRDEMDKVMGLIFGDVNNGVYRCGFAGTQEAYEKAYLRLFHRLDWLSDRLESQRFLMGDTITEADVRLFVTLVRFDPVYHGHFKCNRQKLSEMPVLWAYARDLFQTPGFGDTVDFDHIKRHYYVVHRDINPTGIVPAGPDLRQLAHAARSRGTRRPSVRRRHPAAAAARRRDRPRGAHAARRVAGIHTGSVYSDRPGRGRGGRAGRLRRCAAMRGLSRRVVVPLALVVTAWGGLHVLTSHTVAVTPAVWPVPQPSASPSPSPGGRRGRRRPCRRRRRPLTAACRSFRTLCASSTAAPATPPSACTR